MTMGGLVFFFHPSIFSGSSLGSGSLTTSTSRVLSGDHSKSSTPPLLSVSFSASPPLRLSNQTCEPFFFSSSPRRDVVNARYLPSGLHRGCDSLSLLEVSCTVWVPSQLTIQTSVSRLSFSTSTEPTV